MKNTYNLEPFATIKRRIFHKTQNSSMKVLSSNQQKPTNYQLNQKMLLTLQNKHENNSRVRIKSTSSHKDLFKEAKSLKKNMTYLKTKKEDSFKVPCSSQKKSHALSLSNLNTKSQTIKKQLEQQQINYNNSEIQKKKKHLQLILTKKMRTTSYNSRSATSAHALNTINTDDFEQNNRSQYAFYTNTKKVSENHNKIEQAFSYKFLTQKKNRKQREDDNSKVMKMYQQKLVSESIQTQQNDTETKKDESKFKRNRNNYQEYSINIKQQNKSDKKKEEAALQIDQQNKNKEVSESQTKQIRLFTQKQWPSPIKMRKQDTIQQQDQFNLQIKKQSKSPQVETNKQKSNDKKIQKSNDKKIQKSNDKKVQKNIKHKTLTNVSKQQQVIKNNNYFNHHNDDFLDEIEDIVLSPQSKHPKSKNIKTKTESSQKFKKQKQKQKQKQIQIQKQREKQKQKQREKQKQKQREEQKQKQKQKQRQIKKKGIKQQQMKKQLRKKTQQELIKANEIIDLMTPVGQVAGYCTQMLKKIKLNWHLPAILLYKRCFQTFKKYEDVYQRATEQGILKQQQKQKYFSDNAIIEQNLEKIVNMGRKKGKIQPKYEEIIVGDGKDSKIDSIIQDRVLQFSEQILKSQENKNMALQECLLRMVNGVLILSILHGYKKTPINVEDLSEKNITSKLKDSLLEISKDKIKL